MNWRAQLTRLILSFYRENPEQLKQLRGLHLCKVTRRWGVLRVDCPSSEIAYGLIDYSHLLKEPIAEMRLAQQIAISVNGHSLTSLPVSAAKVNIWKL